MYNDPVTFKILIDDDHDKYLTEVKLVNAQGTSTPFMAELVKEEGVTNSSTFFTNSEANSPENPNSGDNWLTSDTKKYFVFDSNFWIEI